MSPRPEDDAKPPGDNPPAGDNPSDTSGGFPGWAIFIIVLLLVAGAGALAWTLWTRRRRNASSVWPAPARGGVLGWFQSQYRALKNRRTARGAYEPSGVGHRPADDEAWDARVGHDADVYYEDQELGLHPYGGLGGRTEYEGVGGGVAEERGRRAARPGEGYEEGTVKGGVSPLDRNPFGDDAEHSSLRGVSPRPMEGRGGAETEGAQRSEEAGPAK